MRWFKDTLSFHPDKPGLHPVTPIIQNRIREWGIQEGMCYLFIQHTSASLVISESYDPSARIDLEQFMERIAPENQPWYAHTMEGPDDSPSHIKAMLTQTDFSIPIENGALALGTWQGIYLFEHRDRASSRKILIRCLAID